MSLKSSVSLTHHSDIKDHEMLPLNKDENTDIEEQESPQPIQRLARYSKAELDQNDKIIHKNNRMPDAIHTKIQSEQEMNISSNEGQNSGI